MSLLADIKNEIKKSGASKGKFLFFKEDAKVRIRFLTDFEDGLKVPFHDSFQEGINLPCQEIFGRECNYCDMEELRTRNQYIWSVWDYDSKEVKLVMAAVNNCSPVPTLCALYETYGTLLDRDFVITRKGKQQNTSYAIVPMDKAKFRNAKAKPLSKSTILKLLDKAYPDDEREDDEDEVEEENDDLEEAATRTKGNKKGKAASGKKKADDEWEDGEESDVDYEEMSAKELYDLCRERDIDVPKKKPEKFYIKKLKEWDEEQDQEDNDDWDEGEDADDDNSEDEWED